MNTRSDQQLLCDYAEKRSEPAFAELVRRHVDLVYSAALRRVRDEHLAQDITQGTFAALAQNAQTLAGHPVLSGWLHRTTQNIATNLIRTNTRRQTREQEAATMNQLLSFSHEASWQEIAPHLDTALDHLDAADRDAVMLRYFEKKSAAEMAAQLGISDDAAQKRVSRAVERLRDLFAKRGVTVGASGLAVVISANAVQAAPVGLAVAISTAAVLTGSTLATTATVTATKAIAMTALQKTLVTATMPVLAGVGIYEARQASQLRSKVQTLQQQEAPLAEQAKKLQSEHDTATNRLTLLAGEIERLKSNSGELLRLRSEVGVLRAERSRMRDSVTNQSISPAVARWTPQQLTNAGRATPLGALQTLLWAANNGNIEETSKHFVTSLAESAIRSSGNQRLVRDLGQGSRETRSLEFKILSLRKISEDEFQIDVEQNLGPYKFLKTFNLGTFGDGWKVVVSE